VRDLVVAPFAEIADKGKTAVDNAKEADNAAMLRAAQALVREGERALKKMEPLCRKHLDEFGSNFVDALKENGRQPSPHGRGARSGLTKPDEIAQFRTELHDLLWEFDDYVEADEFDADKFSELQALSRKAAPRILDVLMRMKLEAPPQPPELVPATPSTDKASVVHAPKDVQAEPGAVPGRAVVMGAQSGPDLGLDGTPSAPERTGSTRSAAASIPDEVPPEPVENPWHMGQPPSTEAILEGDEPDQTVKRRQRVSARPDSPTVPPPSPPTPDLRSPRQGQTLSVAAPTPHPHPATAVWRPSPSGGQQQSHPTAAHAHAWPIPDPQGPAGQTHPIALTASPNSSRYSQTSSANGSGPSSVFEGNGRNSVYDGISPTTTANRESLLSAGAQSPVIVLSPTAYTPGHHPAAQPSPIVPRHWSPESSAEQPGLEPIRNAVEVDHGLIPVEPPGEQPPSPVMPRRRVDYRINSGSSFHILRGFCEGAVDIQRGGVGVRKVKKLVGCLLPRETPPWGDGWLTLGRSTAEVRSSPPSATIACTSSTGENSRTTARGMVSWVRAVGTAL